MKQKGGLFQTIRDSRKAAADFLRAGRKQESAKEGGFDLYNRFSKMSDDEFDSGVRDGSITPQQIRKAGEYIFDVYMGDVWSEGDHDGEAEPKYEEFMADPEKFGVVEYEADPWRFYRYNPARYKK